MAKGEIEMSELTNDSYLLRFWPSCPDEIIHFMETRVVPAARRNPDSRATDVIVQEAWDCPWYQYAPLSGRSSRFQFHKLTGHIVRIARHYVVDRTPGGKPRMLRSVRGPHKTFTLQIRRHQPGEAYTAYRQFAGGPLITEGVAEIERRFNAGQANSEIAQAMQISLGGVSKRRRLWRRKRAK